MVVHLRVGRTRLVLGYLSLFDFVPGFIVPSMYFCAKYIIPCQTCIFRATSGTPPYFSCQNPPTIFRATSLFYLSIFRAIVVRARFFRAIVFRASKPNKNTRGLSFRHLPSSHHVCHASSSSLRQPPHHPCARRSAQLVRPHGGRRPFIDFGRSSPEPLLLPYLRDFLVADTRPAEARLCHAVQERRRRGPEVAELRLELRWRR